MKLKRFLSLLLTGAVTLSVPALAAPPAGWTPADGARLPAGPWYAEAQAYVEEKGLMTGTDKGFEPEALVTYATVLQTLYHMEGSPNATGNTDPWWTDALTWWAGFSGLGGTMEGDFDIVRGNLNSMLGVYAEKKGFSAEGLMVGNEKGDMMHDKTLTRAEFAQVLMRLDQRLPAAEGVFTARAAAISKYGNVGTDLSMDLLTAAGYEVGDVLTVEITGQTPFTLPLGTGYSNVDQGSPLALADTSNNTLAFAINRGDFATTYGLGVKGEDKSYAITEGVTIAVSMAEKGGYLAEMEIRELDSKRTNNREDYASDEVFANFRPITLGNIAPGRLYRTSSPVNPELGRNTYADGFLKANGVRTVVNLADSREVMEGYEGYADSYYSTLNVIGLNMGVDMYSEDAKAGLKAGFRFLLDNDGPYAFHCTEGKDRAGYFAMVLEALMGASAEEITADYMASFENYYHVEKGSEQWNKIAQSNIVKDLLKLTGAEDEAALAGADLQKAAEAYLVETIGLSEAEVKTLRDALSK